MENTRCTQDDEKSSRPYQEFTFLFQILAQRKQIPTQDAKSKGYQKPFLPHPHNDLLS